MIKIYRDNEGQLSSIEIMKPDVKSKDNCGYYATSNKVYINILKKNAMRNFRIIALSNNFLKK